MSRPADILFVEDDANDLAIALRTFDREGLAEQIAVARDGEQALAWLGLPASPSQPMPSASGPLPKVIFLDLKMPRIDGWEVLREVRANARTRDIPIVIVSSSDREEDVRRCYRLGANGFLVKRWEPGRPGGHLAQAARYWIQLNQVPY